MMESSLLTLAAFALVCSMHASPAQAQRVFVAGTGSDSNPCSFASPCRTFQHAHDTAAPDGEIDVLDPAGYGSIVITKPISIQGHGFSGISGSNAMGCAITINIPSAPTRVNLRGLLIDGVGSGGCGINFQSGTSLSIQECMIRNFGALGAGIGINFVPTSSSDLFVSDTLISDSNQGILIRPLGSIVLTGLLERVDVEHSQNDAIDVNGTSSSGATINVTIAGSAITKSGGNGILALASPTPAATTVVMVRDSTIANNVGTGVTAQGSPALINITRSTITGNGTGLAASSSGQIVSFGDNSLAGNTADGAPTTTIAPK